MVTVDFSANFPTRQAKLRAFLAVHGPSMAELGRRLKVSKERARGICLADRAQKRTLEIMAEAGIPAELLPGLALKEATTAIEGWESATRKPCRPGRFGIGRPGEHNGPSDQGDHSAALPGEPEPAGAF